jgi:hypothetical protein
VIVYFTRLLLLPDLPAHRRKQKQEWRKIFDLKKTTEKHWEQFSNLTDIYFVRERHSHIFPISSTLPSPVVNLNYNWAIFRKCVVSAAKEALPTKNISPYLTSRSDPQDGVHYLKSFLRPINRLFSFLTSVLYPNLSSTSLAKFQYEWFDKPEGNFKSLLVNTLKDLK